MISVVVPVYNAENTWKGVLVRLQGRLIGTWKSLWSTTAVPTGAARFLKDMRQDMPTSD